jgi:hypothetical protein
LQRSGSYLQNNIQHPNLIPNTILQLLKKMQQITKDTVTQFLRRTGFSSKTPRDVVHEAKSMGGLGWNDMAIERGLQNIASHAQLRNFLNNHQHLAQSMEMVNRIQSSSKSQAQNHTTNPEFHGRIRHTNQENHSSISTLTGKYEYLKQKAMQLQMHTKEIR